MSSPDQHQWLLTFLLTALTFGVGVAIGGVNTASYLASAAIACGVVAGEVLRVALVRHRSNRPRG